MGTIPSDDARSFWNDALGAFEHGGSECVAGTGANDELRASEGIREVQKGISRLASAMSLIRVIWRAADDGVEMEPRDR